MRHLPTLPSRVPHRANPVVAVLVFMDGNTRKLWTVNPDGTALKQITHVAPDYVTRPDRSPDGGHITASVTPDFVHSRLGVMNADGTHLHQVFTDLPLWGDILPRFFPTEQDLTTFAPGVFDDAPAVSPDGRWIVLPRFYADGRPGRLHLIRASGGTPSVIPLPAQLRGSFGPDWTPDGENILLSTPLSSGGSALFRVHLDGTGARQLTHPTGGHSGLDHSVAVVIRDGRRSPAFPARVQHPAAFDHVRSAS